MIQLCWAVAVAVTQLVVKKCLLTPENKEKESEKALYKRFKCGLKFIHTIQ